ncbi:MAG: DUF5612 domain-containing protein [Methanosphaera sp.]|uniref:DUF5612 domain-containing protein n=1 Tax=Methanosphaera sp. TaxID=2666342 RepID=UPI0025E0E84D|nr:MULTISPECIES: DUF5612 domain-containing protein [Methanobacteriaceae]MCI5866847.1 DUF5612 domain-containing protein [Methanosphaera sp.]MDD6534354.1 DUF5612 domain-containing protein [Methanosphaera sp.]MDY3955241.1 DUF5612 domain-containing protein [Methanosphaera sp.]
MTKAITLKTIDKPGVLREITDFIANKGINITYTHLYMESNDYASTYIEFDDVDNVDSLVEDLLKLPEIVAAKTDSSMSEIWGKRIIIIGGGAQVSQVALGAITEADRHNLRGERISIDTLPLVGEEKLSQVIEAVSSLPRVGVLVLAGSIMGGSIVDSIDKLKEDYGIKVISLNMVGSVRDHADLVVTDPVQAGVMAVMTVAKTAKFDIDRVDEVL